jgi:16S rRNA processing protein RimM
VDRVLIAQFGAAHGVRGEVRLKPFTEDPLSVTHYGPLEAEDGRRFEIEAARPAKDMLVVRLKGVADRNAAEALKNLRLYVAREKLPAPADDEFYHADLVGLAAQTTGGEAFGVVKAVHNFGAGDLLEIEPAAGGPTVLLPFSETSVPTVDIAGRRIVVAPYEDSLERSPLVGEGGEASEAKPSRVRGSES